jgi:peptidoglycan/xylan/chitin deacetylase (PgdA/CDA1 family)
MYHYVEYVKDKGDTIRQSLNINPYTFEAQVKTLSEAGYTFMTAREVGEVMDGTKILPPNPIVLTFDDGHWDIVTDVLPILKKYNANGTVYMISDFIDGSDFMSEKQLLEVVDSGIMEVGAHTAHHVSLKGITPDTVKKEVSESKKTLEEKLHIKVYSFAYPNGAFDLPAAHIVEDEGFTTAVSTVPGVNVNQANRYFLFRLRPGGRIGKELLNWLDAERAKGLANGKTEK